MTDPNAHDFWDSPRSMREASRRYLVRKAVVAARPSTGIYWWIPQPDGSWSVLAFHDEFYSMNSHTFMWRHVVDHLHTLYPDIKVDGDIAMTYAGLPRGRVAENRKGQVNVYHGNDSPGDLALVRTQFNLPADANLVFDDHEEMLDLDKMAVERALGGQ